MDALVGGKLRYVDGCLLLDTMPVIWPEGTEWDRARRRVVLPNQQVVQLGDRVRGGGGALDDEAGMLSHVDQPARDALRGCFGRTKEVAAFNIGGEVSLATDTTP